jgi:hypothetical protein
LVDFMFSFLNFSFSFDVFGYNWISWREEE